MKRDLKKINLSTELLKPWSNPLREIPWTWYGHLKSAMPHWLEDFLHHRTSRTTTHTFGLITFLSLYLSVSFISVSPSPSISPYTFLTSAPGAPQSFPFSRLSLSLSFSILSVYLLSHYRAIEHARTVARAENRITRECARAREREWERKREPSSSPRFTWLADARSSSLSLVWLLFPSTRCTCLSSGATSAFSLYLALHLFFSTGRVAHQGCFVDDFILTSLVSVGSGGWV